MIPPFQSSTAVNSQPSFLRWKTPVETRLPIQATATRFGANTESTTPPQTRLQPTSTAALAAQPIGRPTLFSKILGHRSRATLGIVFEDIVPPMLGFAFVAGPVGWALTLGSPVLSYVSGKFGRYIARDVHLTSLPTSMQKLQDFRKALNTRENLQQGELVDKWNQFIDDALNIKASRFKGLANFALNKLKMSQTGFVGRIFNNPNFLKAKMYSNISHANSMGGAVKAGARGGFSFWFYQHFLPGVGRLLEKVAAVMPGPLKWPFKLMGWIMDHFPALKLAKDMILPGHNQIPPQARGQLARVERYVE